MARKQEPIKFKCFISIDGAPPIPFDDMTPEQRERCGRVWSKRLSAVGSDYFTQHPEEFKPFCDSIDRLEKAKALKSKGMAQNES